MLRAGFEKALDATQVGLARRAEFERPRNEGRRKTDALCRAEVAEMRRHHHHIRRTQIEKVETLHHHYTLFHDRLLPLARQAAQASEIAYSNDRGTLLELITAQRAVRDAESALQDHLTDYLAATAELEAMAGAPLSSAETSESNPPKKP